MEQSRKSQYEVILRQIQFQVIPHRQNTQPIICLRANTVTLVLLKYFMELAPSC